MSLYWICTIKRKSLNQEPYIVHLFDATYPLSASVVWGNTTERHICSCVVVQQINIVYWAVFVSVFFVCTKNWCNLSPNFHLSLQWINYIQSTCYLSETKRKNARKLVISMINLKKIYLCLWIENMCKLERKRAGAIIRTDSILYRRIILIDFKNTKDS